MQTSAKIMEMTGYCVGHSIWRLCDGDSLLPLVGYLEVNDHHSLRQLTETAPAINTGQQGAVSIRRGRMGVAEQGQSGCLSLDMHSSVAPKFRLQYLLPFRSDQHERGFASHLRRALTGIRPDSQPYLTSELLVIRQSLEGHLSVRGSRFFSTALLVLAGDLVADVGARHQVVLERLRLCLGLSKA